MRLFSCVDLQQISIRLNTVSAEMASQVFVACNASVRWFRSEHLKTDARKREQKKKMYIKSFNIY